MPAADRQDHAAQAAVAPPAPRLFAVIDVGTTSVRMEIAQVDHDGAVARIESLQQAVSLGKDVFTAGRIETETIEQCVEALRTFQAKLQEYRIIQPDQVRAVATSAVREAGNREAFLDRLYIGSGINVEDIDAAEVNRYTYLSVKPLIESEERLRNRDTVIVEVGGGSTELLLVQSGQVASSHSYRLGSVRIREMIEDFRAPSARMPDLLENTIRTALQQIRHDIRLKRNPNLLALGGDARFAAFHLVNETEPSGLSELRVPALSELTDGILRLSVDDLVRTYHLTYPDAETLGPALLAYTRLAQALDLRRVFVAGATLRDGLLADMTRDSWTDDFTEQIIRSSLQLGRKYDFEATHAEHVAALSRQIFRALREEHRLAPRYEIILAVAAILHEVGLFVSNRSHHKHSLYLIQNSEVFGLGPRDLNLVALVARYHRRATPSLSHDGYAALDREERIAVAKLAAILRVADALDRGHAQRIREIDIRTEPGQMAITAHNVSDLTLEQLGLQQKGGMFEQVYGMRVLLRPGRRRQ